jgi:hypothetical protein
VSEAQWVDWHHMEDQQDTIYNQVIWASGQVVALEFIFITRLKRMKLSSCMARDKKKCRDHQWTIHILLSLK